MAFKYDRYDTRRPARRHGILTYWVPVVVTTTLAVGGLAAWVWSSRDHDEPSSDDDDHLSYGGHDTDREARAARSVSEGIIRDEASARATGVAGTSGGPDDNTLLGRVQGVIRRTPSPQQLFDGASKRVVAGVAAAGAVVGGALSSIREEDKDDFGDHERWRQDTANRGFGVSGGVGDGKRSIGLVPGGKRRTVVIVLSAEEGDLSLEDEESKGWRNEHAVSQCCAVRTDPP
jgi:hypothetical protein